MLAPLPTERKTLLDAADLIELRGHCKFRRQGVCGEFCVMGAISFAQDGNIYSAFTYDPPGELLSKYLGGAQPVHWNNAEERTKEEVVAALRGAAFHGL